MKKLLMLPILVVALFVGVAVAPSPASGDPFYCDRAPVNKLVELATVENAAACGSTGVCYWEYLGNGLWMEKCLPYCEVYYCG